MNDTSPANAAQIDFWNSDAVRTAWVAMQVQMDRQLAPFGEAAIAAVRPLPGDAMLDIGCGCGATSLALARHVGPAGRVFGVDISEPMLDIARARVAELAAPPTFHAADAQTADLGEGLFDAIFSRFGVMFFAVPEAAFTNLRRALKPQGRLAFVCWRSRAENPWLTVPLEAARHLLPPLPKPDPLAPGPFSFADRTRIEGILRTAGFADIRIDSFDTMIGGGDLEETTLLATRVGPLAGALREYPEARKSAPGVVREALAPYLTDTGVVMMPAAVWIVRATRA